jgi:hypothetical protein
METFCSVDQSEFVERGEGGGGWGWGWGVWEEGCFPMRKKSPGGHDTSAGLHGKHPLAVYGGTN